MGLYSELLSFYFCCLHNHIGKQPLVVAICVDIMTIYFPVVDTGVEYILFKDHPLDSCGS